MNTIKRYFGLIPRLVLYAAAMMTLVSCMAEDAFSEMDGFMSEVEFSGTVYDYDTAEGVGVGNMMVVLTSYDVSDKNFSYPIYRDTTYTGMNGSYCIRLMSRSTGWNFRATVKDNFPDREGGCYSMLSSYDPLLHVEFKEYSFDKDAGIFRFDGIDIPVSR